MTEAAIAMFTVLFSTLAIAELSPQVYREMQTKAPTVLVVNVLRVQPVARALKSSATALIASDVVAE